MKKALLSLALNKLAGHRHRRDVHVRRRPAVGHKHIRRGRMAVSLLRKLRK